MDLGLLTIMVKQSNQISEAAICKCSHAKLYHMSSTITNMKTEKITPVEFCLECECSKFIEKEHIDK
jgi:hypothetical protein